MPARRMFQQPRPKATQRNRIQGHLLSQRHITVGEGPHTISGSLHRPFKVRSFLFWPSNPPVHRGCGRKPKMGWEGLQATIICQATLSLTGLCYRSLCPQMRGHLTHAQAFQLFSHWREVYTPFSHLGTTTWSPVCSEVLEFSSKR